MSHPDCPYTVGAEFVLTVRAPQYRDNAVFHLRVKIRHVYTFTNSQVMKVSVINGSGDYDIRHTAILKLYDPRFLEERMIEGAADRWTLESQLETDTITDELYQMHETAGFSTPTGVDSESDLEYTDEEDKCEQHLEKLQKSHSTLVNRWKAENHYRRRVKWTFENECEAYEQLHPLQGICIPAFFGTTEFDESWKTSLNIRYDIKGILIQYIDGLSLEEIKPNSPTALANCHLGQAILLNFEKLSNLGVLHGDVRLPNIIVQNDGRIFFIDFGLAFVRWDEESDEDWAKRVLEEGETTDLKLLLDKLGLRDRTPPSPFAIGPNGYFYYNKSIESSRPCWRDRYYEPTPESLDADKDDYEVRENESRTSYMYYCLAKWRPKADAILQRKRDLGSVRLSWLLESDRGNLRSPQV